MKLFQKLVESAAPKSNPWSISNPSKVTPPMSNICDVSIVGPNIAVPCKGGVICAVGGKDGAMNVGSSSTIVRVSDVSYARPCCGVTRLLYDHV